MLKEKEIKAFFELLGLGDEEVYNWTPERWATFLDPWTEPSPPGFIITTDNVSADLMEREPEYAELE